MPFTPSHAVVALPFLRTPLLPAAIAVGAMAPDLPLFLRGTPLTYTMTHSNVLVATLLALALLALWYGLLRPAVRELSPRWLARRLPPEWDAPGPLAWRALRAERHGAVFTLLLALSLLIGVVSHIVWDAFTHAGRWGLHLIPALADTWGPWEGYRWMQHASSVLGLLALAVFAALWVRRRHPDVTFARLLPGFARAALWLALPACLVVAWGWGVLVYGPLRPAFTIQHLAYQVLPVACAVWGALALALCVFVLLARARAARHAR